MPLPFDGIRVLDLGISTAGPYSARFLADLGAEVIKVEPLEGENARNLGLRYGGTGYLYHVNNYNKKSLSLTVQSDAGRQIFLDLVRISDVVVENFALGTMDRWGIGYAACRDANPSIVYCSAKGFGENGPLKAKKAFDTVSQALSGIMHLTGAADEPPLKGGPSVCDLMTATVSAMAVAAALARRVPGESQIVDTSLFDMGAWSLLQYWPQAAQAPSHLGNGHPAEAPYGDFDCRDGAIFLSVLADAEWKPLADALDLPPEWDRAARKQREAEIADRLAGWLAPQDAMTACAALQAMSIAAAPILSIGQVVDLPIVAHRQMLKRVRHAVFGEIPLIGSPVAADGASGDKIRALAPVLGESNDEIVGGLLARADELAALRQEKVVG